MKLSENWYVDAPWAQLVCSTKIPDDKIKKLGAKWTKRLRPQVSAQMKDAYKTRMGKGSTAVLHDED